MTKEAKTIVVSEDHLWNTLHPYGYARFLESYARFLRGYDNDSGYAYDLGHTLGMIDAAIYVLQNLDFNDLDWAEFRRRNPPIQELQKAKRDD